MKARPRTRSTAAAPPPAPATEKRKRGRPRSRLADDQLEQIGGPPVDDPLKMMRWWHATEARLAWWRLRGEVSKELVESFRASAKVAASTAPLDVIQHAEDLVRRAEEALGDEADRGPEVEEVNDGTRKALRRPGR